jgi:hypothetical protein
VNGYSHRYVFGRLLWAGRIQIASVPCLELLTAPLVLLTALPLNGRRGVKPR